MFICVDCGCEFPSDFRISDFEWTDADTQKWNEAQDAVAVWDAAHAMNQAFDIDLAIAMQEFARRASSTNEDDFVKLEGPMTIEEIKAVVYGFRDQARLRHRSDALAALAALKEHSDLFTAEAVLARQNKIEGERKPTAGPQSKGGRL